MSSNVLTTDSMSKPRRVRVLRAPTFSPLSLVGNLRTLWQYRDLLLTLTMHRIKVRYKQSVLGIAWAILQPLSLMLIYTLIFSFIAKVPTGDTPYAIFAYAALLPWTYFATSVGNATNSLVSHSELVTKVYFPREILPLSYVIAALCDFLIASSVMAGLMIHYHVSVTINVLYCVPIILVLTLFIGATTLILSATQVRFRDIGVAVPLLLQLWMFATPVVYPLSAVPERFRALYVLNPMVGTIENFRRTVLQGLAPDFYTLGLSAAVSVVLLLVAYVYFKHVEATVADLV
ncbi:MAG: ABC transporter permease [Acidobacteria bacterium]|nr:ABC transporter permease [Acidobacteriota bacterium]